jgi:hypothetical protein
MAEFEEEQELKIETIFKEDTQIDEIYDHSNPINFVFEILETHYRVTTGQIDYDSNLIMALSEFHVNNLIFFKETYKGFPNIVYRKLLNLLNILLNLKDEKSQKIIQEQEEEINNDPDFNMICKKKLSEIKKGLFLLNLVHDKNSSDNPNAFYLKSTEISHLLDYIRTFYFPFIRLYYHFINIQKITENKKIEVIVNRPLPVPGLRDAVLQVQEKNSFEDQKEVKKEKEEKVKVY